MFTLNCNGKLLVVDKPLVMGIINATPDSFFAGSRQQTIDMALKKAEQMLSEGADMLDIGGQSTRPGSERVNEEVEKERVLPVIHAIADRFPEIIISVDTFYSGIARQSVEAGASIINDVSAGEMDNDFIATVASLRVPYVLMHIPGKLDMVKEAPDYKNISREVLDFFITKIAALREAGIHDIIADPGFGFGKTPGHNFELLSHLEVFSMLRVPVLAGVSRKSTIWKTLGITADEALNGTTVLNTVALMKGASMLRVHDVKEAKEAVTLLSYIKK